MAQALIAIRRRESIDVLLKLLPRADGQVLADIVSFLAFVSGQPPANDTAGWMQWWEETVRDFQFPNFEPDAAPAVKAIAGGSHYYGVPLYANRMVFVLDTRRACRGRGSWPPSGN